MADDLWDPLAPRYSRRGLRPRTPGQEAGYGGHSANRARRSLGGRDGGPGRAVAAALRPPGSAGSATPGATSASSEQRVAASAADGPGGATTEPVRRRGVIGAGRDGGDTGSFELGCAGLLMAGPLLALSAELSAERALLQRLAPSSDAAQLLDGVVKRLRRALASAATLGGEVSVAEAATVLHLSTSAVRWRITHGQLPARRDGRCYRIPRRALRHTAPPATSPGAPTVRSPAPDPPTPTVEPSTRVRRSVDRPGCPEGSEP